MPRFLALVITVAALMSAAGLSGSNPVAGQSPEAVATATATADAELRIEVLEAQLEEMQSGNDRLLTVVAWALAVPGVLFVALLGFNIYQLKWGEAQNQKAVTNQLRTELSEELTDTISRIQDHLEQTASDIEANAEQRIAALEEANAAWQTQQEQETDRVIKLNREISDAKLDLATSSLQDHLTNQFARLERNFNQMQYRMLVEEVTESLKAPGLISVNRSLELLKLARSLEYPPTPGQVPRADFQTMRALNMLVQTLDHIHSEKSDFPALLSESDVNEIGVILTELPDTYAISRDTIRAKLIEIDRSY